MDVIFAAIEKHNPCNAMTLEAFIVLGIIAGVVSVIAGITAWIMEAKGTL